ncbi:MAG: hypothetical protein Q8S33_02295 [Myxococcales bacterium]|nr:hypothetical protein [Myxococcales bacterium]
MRAEPAVVAVFGTLRSVFGGSAFVWPPPALKVLDRDAEAVGAFAGAFGADFVAPAVDFAGAGFAGLERAVERCTVEDFGFVTDCAM